MADQNKFGHMPGATPGGGGLRCEEWEALLVDALDGLLPAADAAAFKVHTSSCAACAELLEHARQGQEWLEFLHPEPEVPGHLVGRILEKTAGAGAMPLPVVAAAQSGGAVALAMPLRRSFHETRLLMTVAMAFFSIALTLNLAGVRVTNLRMADLRPSAIGGALSRQFYGARGQVVRYYENLRFVYQLESRLRELRRDTEPTPPASQPQTPSKAAPARQGGSGKDGSSKADSDPGSVLAAERTADPELKTAKTEQKQQQTEVRVSETTTSPLSLDQCQAGLWPYLLPASYNGRSLA